MLGFGMMWSRTWYLCGEIVGYSYSLVKVGLYDGLWKEHLRRQYINCNTELIIIYLGYSIHTNGG